MSDPPEKAQHIENEELLESQSIFKGPRRIRKNLLKRFDDDDMSN